MDELESLRPTSKIRVMDLLEKTGYDTSQWALNFRGRHPSANPRFCYNWSFLKPHDFIVACMWHIELTMEGEDIFYSDNLRKTVVGKGKAQWSARAAAYDEHLKLAYQEAMPVRAVILAGKPRDDDDEATEASLVIGRRLDDMQWAVTRYDYVSGDFTITRGALPSEGHEQDDPEYSAFEGEQRRLYVVHRRRESSLRTRKLLSAGYVNDGVIRCEVPGCGFDFNAVYGEIGKGFAHVHHLLPLSDAPEAGISTSLKDLAIVCANCHAMIHVGGNNRPLDSLKPKQR